MITVVCGYPGAGKTTYVKEHKKYDDVMLDLDIIYNAITDNKHYDIKPKNIVEYINDLIKATIHKQKEYNFDIWLVRCMPDDIEIEMLKEYNAKFIWMNTDREECMKRLIIDKRLMNGFEFICNRIDKQRSRCWE